MKNCIRSHSRPSRAGAPPARQKGISIVLVAIALVALVGISGLALDGGHMMLNKTRLQNTVDAAALSAAKIVDQTADIDAGRQAALDTFTDNASGSGNQELADAYDGGSGDIDVSVQFSTTLNPFTPGSPDGPYVRVIATDFRLPVFLSRVVGIDDKRVAATAVAGPSPTLDEACNIAPVMVCGDADAPLFGLEPGTLQALKLPGGSNNGNQDLPLDCEVGPGNYQLIRLGGSGADIVRNALAGGFEGCINLEDEVETQPGVATGPVAQGLNTRFGEYSGPMGGTQSQYPPDVVVTEPQPNLDFEENDKGTCEDDEIKQGGTTVEFADDIDFNFAQYQAAIQSGQYDFAPLPDGTGAFERRVLAVPIVDCSVGAQGQSTLPLLSFGCFFVLQRAPQQGNNSQIFGEFLGECDAGGTPGPNPGAGPGPHIIQLYKDPNSTDS